MPDLYIYGDVGYELRAADVVAELDALPAKAELTVRISSAGGDVFEGFTIANRIRAHQGPTVASIEGLAASMATVIALAADRVVMAEDSFFMIHNPQAVFATGEADDLRRQADTMDSVADRMVAIYAGRGLEETQVRAWMDAETWFTAAEAFAAGFIDEISQPRAVLAAHAGFLRLDRFAHPPQLEEANPMKTRLSITLNARLNGLATDATARKSLLDQVVALADLDLASLEMLLDGSQLVTPSDVTLEAFAGVLGLGLAQLQADRQEDFPDAPAPTAAAEPAVATPNVDALHRHEGAASERKRMLEIRALFKGHTGHDALRDQCIENGTSVDAASRMLLDALGRDTHPATPANAPGRVYAVEDRSSKFRVAAIAALVGRTNDSYRREHRDELARNEFSGYTLMELARSSMELAGHRTQGVDRFELVGLAFTTTDFPQILADVANKSLMIGFEEAPETWNQWARIGNLQDFKPHKRASLSEYDDLLLINNGSEEFKRGEFTDIGEDIKAETYGRLFSITRQAIINDDANAFTGIPNGMGRAAARKVGDLAYDVLINGQTSSETGNNTYSAPHNNLVSQDLDQTSLDAARAQMRKQPGPLNTEKGGAAGAQALNISPAYLVVPPDLEGTALGILNGQYGWIDGATDTTRANIVRGLAEVVVDARIVDVDSWHLAASPNMHPTIEVGFVDGRAEPRLEQQQAFTTDGTDFKVATDFGVRVLDWRGLYKSTGSP